MITEKDHFALLLTGCERSFQAGWVAPLPVGKLCHQVVVLQDALAAVAVFQRYQCPAFTAVTAEGIGFAYSKAAGTGLQGAVPVKAGVTADLYRRIEAQHGVVVGPCNRAGGGDNNT